MDVRNYVALVRERGWSPREFERWYVDVTAAMLYKPGA
jgi:hypothetical protein